MRRDSHRFASACARRIAALLLLAWLCGGRTLVAQTFNPRDDRYRALGLLRARAEYERASAEWLRARELRARALASAAELEEREAARVRARVDLLQQALALTDAAPHVLIERARRRRLASGATEVELVLAGVSGSEGEAESLLATLEPELRREVQAQSTGRLFVSLKASAGAEGTVIATPYERVLPRLAGGARARTTFRLVRETAEVVVSLDFGGRVEERRILLETEGGAAGIALDVPQPAQEADLGAQASYDVTLERLRDDVAGVRVAVEGLPQSVIGEVRAAESDARLSVVRFALGERAKRVRVLVALPRDAGGGVAADRALRFVVAAEPSGGESVAGPLGVSAVRVAAELMPRGVPRAELRLAAGWAEVRAGDTVRMAATMRNAGTRALSGVRVLVEAPPGWGADAVPASLASLAPGTDAPIAVRLVPDAAASAGDYEARLRLDGGAGERPLESEPRMLRVRVVPAGRGWSGWGLALLLVAGALVAVRAGRRLMAR